MARSNLHELATRFLEVLNGRATDQLFEGKLSEIAVAAGMNSVRSSEAVRLLEELGRIEVIQRGRRGRETIIKIMSTDEVSSNDVAGSAGPKPARRSRISYDEIGKAVVDRLLELSRDDGLRSAQVEAFARENSALRERIEQLEGDLALSERRETVLRVELNGAKEALTRSEENLRRLAGGEHVNLVERPVEDEDARAVLDILRSGGGA